MKLDDDEKANDDDGNGTTLVVALDFPTSVGVDALKEGAKALAEPRSRMLRSAGGADIFIIIADVDRRSEVFFEDRVAAASVGFLVRRRAPSQHDGFSRALSTYNIIT